MKFIFDINHSSSCNFKCSYCDIPFKNSLIDKSILKDIIKLVKDCLNHNEFKKRYSEIQISFFGGEPTLNLDGMKFVTEALKDEPVSYFLYSNGYKYKPELWAFLESFKNTEKFLTQISYDGLASHNIDRLTKGGKQTALEVKETIYELHSRGLDYTIHSTLAAKNFNCLYDNYTEFKRMAETGIDCSYNPTIDYLSKFEFSASEIASIKEVLKTEFLKILPLTEEFRKSNGYYDFGWFNYQKAICGAGNGYFGIDIDGSILPCHGNFSSDKKKSLIFANVSKATPEVLLEESAKYAEILKWRPKECADCYTHLCWKCNAAKYEISTKTEYPWVDYTNQPGLCEIFKYIGRFMIAVNTQIAENSQNLQK